MRLRQVVLAARDLDSVVGELRAAFSIEVSFNDPGVREFGLVNAVMPVGDTFLEVVSPISADAPARRFLDRRGDGGYMVILQSDRLDEDRERLGRLGVRVVWKIDLPDIRGTHLHPKDVGGAILSLDDATPPESWRWAGPGWERKVRTERVREISGVVLESPDARSLAGRWAEILDLSAREDGDAFEIALRRGRIRFVTGPSEGIVAFEIRAAEPGREVTIGGARFHLTE